jgi:ATP-binding cassette, subfamily C, bacterial exporter for protease/lipase
MILNKPANVLSSLLWAFKLQYFSVLAFSVIINLLMLVPSWYMLQVYDRVLTSHDDNTLLGLSLIALFIYLVYALLERARGWILIEVAEAFDARIAPILHRGLLSVRVPTGLRESGALNDLNTIKQFMTGQPILSFLDAPWAVIYLAVIFLLHPSLGWLSLFSMLSLFLLALLNQRFTSSGLDRSREFALQERRWVSNISSALDSIHVMGMRPAMQSRLADIRSQYLSHLLSASGRGVNFSAMSKWIRTVIQSAALGYGAYLAIHNEITSGMIIAATILLGRALAPIDGVINSWKQWSDFRKSYTATANLASSVPQVTHSVQLGRPQGHLVLDEVTLQLRQNGPAALQQVSMSIAAGQTVAVIGPSGAGKTTLLKALAGVLLPTQGRVLMDGADLAFRDDADLGRFIGYLGQDTGLLAGRVSENIARFGPVNSTTVIAAAQLAGAHEMLMALPEGYETELGDRGMGLSEGQKRRIGLARALYESPAVVLLDEPGTALDDASAANLVKTLKNLKAAGVTVVFTTHQPYLVQQADMVALLVDGKLRILGPREEVLTRLSKN